MVPTRQLLFLWLILTLPVATSAQSYDNLTYDDPAAVGMSEERLARIPPHIRQYVTNGRLAGATTMIARQGNVVHFETYGVRNLQTGEEMEPDTIFRIYSMTKPITSLAVMMLYEQGSLQITDPVSEYLPGFGDLRVVGEGGVLEPLERPMTIQHLLTHTSGLTYGVFGNTLVDRMYREAQVMESPDNTTLIERLSEIPLQYQPGTRFHYSVSTDVLGALVEAVSGQSLGEFFQERIFEPLRMNDTFFEVPRDKLDRFGTNHSFDPATGELVVSDPAGPGSNFVNRETFQSGGGGLLSTTGDYMRFAQMLLNGGELDGARIISPKTLEFMTRNHLPGIFGDHGEHPGDILPGFVDGTGFGLGFAVIEDPTRSGGVASPGEYYWGGAAGTIFWIDPVEELTGIVMIQHMNVPFPLRAEFKALTYGAIAE